MTSEIVANWFSSWSVEIGPAEEALLDELKACDISTKRLLDEQEGYAIGTCEGLRQIPLVFSSALRCHFQNRSSFAFKGKHMSKTFSIRISDEQHADLAAKAAQESRSINQLIGFAIDAYLSKKPVKGGKA